MFGSNHTKEPFLAEKCSTSHQQNDIEWNNNLFLFGGHLLPKITHFSQSISHILRLRVHGLILRFFGVLQCFSHFSIVWKGKSTIKQSLLYLSKSVNASSQQQRAIAEKKSKIEPKCNRIVSLDGISTAGSRVSHSLNLKHTKKKENNHNDANFLIKLHGIWCS